MGAQLFDAAQHHQVCGAFAHHLVGHAGVFEECVFAFHHAVQVEDAALCASSHLAIFVDDARVIAFVKMADEAGEQSGGTQFSTVALQVFGKAVDAVQLLGDGNLLRAGRLALSAVDAVVGLA